MGKRVKPEVIYLDTSALIALFNSRDKNHKSAKNFLERTVLEGSLFVIGRPVLLEFINGASKHQGKRVAIELRKSIIQSKFIWIENENESDWQRAWSIFERFDDHNGMDLTDCLSFAMMERLGIKKAFTYDADFETYGFVKLP
nr:type II toxin-antitoxin system VapC family toxin [Thermococcus sp.]